MKLVIYPPVGADRLARIIDAAGAMRVVNATDDSDALDAIVDADAFYGKLTPDLLAAATRLRWVQAPTASLEHYLFPALVEHPCTLTNMRGLYSDVIADQVLGYVICFARNLHLYIRQQIEARWMPIGSDRATPDYALGQSVSGPMDRTHLHLADCTLGVVGLGAIGSEIARRASAFDMRIVAVDPSRADPPTWVESLWQLDRLDDLLAESDFVVVAAPHTPETEGMFRREQFRRMKRSAYFVNIGRGAIVSLDALVESLRAGEIAGAALDVYEIEPLPREHPLWAMDNAILTPHVAGASVHVAARHEAILVQNVGRFARSEPLLNVADKEVWY